MQMVSAKCIMAASLSSPVQQYFTPGGGPLPGGLYEIDRDGPLADLKTTGGKSGKYVFQFDRNASPGEEHDYTCKKEACKEFGKDFKTLAALGSHTRSAHKDETVEDIVPAVVPVDGRGRKKGKTFKCKHPGCGEVLPHLYALKIHKKTHETDAVTKAA